MLEGEERLSSSVEHVYASDLMSDVLAFGKPNSFLVTGLATQQAVISAHVAEFKGVVFIRGKRPKDGAERLSRDNQLVLMSTDLDMYDACVRIDSVTRGVTVEPVAVTQQGQAEKMLLSNEFVIHGDDFAKAGIISTDIKATLKKIGFDSKLVRKVAICTYEAEMNVVMHADHGTVKLSVTPQMIEVLIEDRGKGIPDVEQAMQEGFTTSTEEMRAMGFGAGMGLPNIKRNSDELDVISEVGVGTTLRMKFVI